MKIFEAAEKMWNGEISAFNFAPANELVQVAAGTWFFNGVSNMTMVMSEDGLIVVDPGAATITIGRDGNKEPDCIRKYRSVRTVTHSPLHTLIYTHGHADHIYGGAEYVAECWDMNHPYPHVIAHEAIVRRLERYREMARQINLINRRQFRAAADHMMLCASPEMAYTPPNILYRDVLELKVGGKEVLIQHGCGETDDHSWVFFPQTGVLCTGDFFIWAMPNAGNPQKVQRYVGGWAKALRAMAALKPKILLPGHGLFILGQDRVAQALDDTAGFLESIYEQTIAFMNQGMRLEEVIASVQMPDHLRGKAYLKPEYDELEFIVRNLWRLYGGWYDGVPSHLKPVPEKALADEIAILAGGAASVAERAKQVLAQGDVRMATHLAEWAHLAAPDDEGCCLLAQTVYAKRAEVETSLMAKGIFASASKEMSLGSEHE